VYSLASARRSEESPSEPGASWSAVAEACTLHAVSIPKGLCPPAQGCEQRATLGKVHHGSINLEEVAPPWTTRRIPSWRVDC